MAKTVSADYRDIAGEFTKRVSSKLGSKVNAILLYGSVSRGEARKDSDIDILIVTPYAHTWTFKDRIYTILTDFELENDFRFLISLFIVTPNELKRQILLGTPFIRNVDEDRIGLYNGRVWERYTQKAYWKAI